MSITIEMYDKVERERDRFAELWRATGKDKDDMSQSIAQIEALLLEARRLLIRYQAVTIQADDIVHDSLWDDTARYLAPKMAPTAKTEAKP